MVSVPATNPSEAVAFTVRVAVLPGPIVTCWTVPMVFPPVVNVIGPVSVPAPAGSPLTAAAKVTLLAKGKLAGVMVTVVVVAAVPCATTVTVTLELVDPMYVVFPELKIAETE